ncbi:hypothetical protein [Streptosporangium sp. NBC_01469]|uniref:hypothetical protein n=1 Tax=Streptosporangium sp. NBC_01469 TaxID=2903898 RepID=UPI002E28F999|nr:hypothetical protein [Streptosporangium sp. NBC_01469]
MPFDEERYVREVLDPARQAGGTPPEDLRLRYQLRDSMSGAEVTSAVRQVRQCWRRQRQMLRFRRLVDRLEADHAGYAPIFAAAAEGDLGPLRAELRRAGERTGERLASLRRRLDDAAGRLRMLPPEIVLSIARSAGSGARDAERLAAELGIEVTEPDRLPEAPPYSGYAKAREALDTLGRRHLAEFVFGEPCRGMRVLGAVSVPGAPSLPGRIDRVEAEWGRRTRGPWTTGAGTVLTALRNTPDPAELIRYDIVARLRERVREHPYDDTLLRHAVEELDLDQADARRLVFAVRHEGGAAGGPAARLRELVDAGEVQAASDLAEALDGLTGEAAELAVEIRARLAEAVRLRDLALASGDPDRAWIAVQDALRRVPDLPGAADLLARLAPHPAREPRAETRDGAVTVTWRPSASRAGEISYEVLRDGVPLPETGGAAPPGTGPGAGDVPPGTADGLPPNATGGVPPNAIGDVPPDTTGGTSARDAAPPVNVPVTYAVVARRGAARAAPVAAAPVVVRPEPREVRLVAGDGVVTGRWVTPREALRVVVTRDGRPVRVEGSGFRDREVTNGTDHVYVVGAVYPGPGERTTATPGVRVAVTPHARPEPVAEFGVEPDPSAPGRLVVRCADPPSGRVEFLSLETAPPWPYGTTLSLDEVGRAGRTLSGTPVGGGWLVRPAHGSGVLVALTVAGDVATVGAHREHLTLAPPLGLVAQRRGTSILVGFDWPAEVPEVEVRWSGRSLPVSAASYRAQGGVRLDAPEGDPVTVEVAPATVVRGRRVCGPAATVSLEAVVPVGYDLLTRGPPWRRSLVVEVSSPRPVRVARLTLVLRPGPNQPRSPEQGRVLAEWTEVTPPARFTVPLPRQAGPYWLRCFAEGDVELVDPPVRRMKSG